MDLEGNRSLRVPYSLSRMLARYAYTGQLPDRNTFVSGIIKAATSEVERKGRPVSDLREQA